MNTTTDTRLPTKALMERFGVSDRTVDRWLQDDALNFPQPLVINRRRYWSLQEIEQWERSRAAGKPAA
ncbi:helix-turn-helix transcriptional regulator [Phenylobacterium sp.]|uniref:helix-turn-helix transcriptional regulator n=1 Tax=Phenylobacterium sp. TaxID=1871053 RepID=UPI003561E11C